MKRALSIVLLTLMSLGAMLAVAPAGAAQRTRCFDETGYCVSGPILAYWENNGGLPVFGYPISPLWTETVEGWTGPVQWFQRDRLEDHGPEGVLAGRLGALLLEQQGRPWKQGIEAPQPARRLCKPFEQTGYNLCAPFRLYWEQNGGLERFGYPITGIIEEEIEGKRYQVQYFERRRMEYHPENTGTPYEILLGLLGSDLIDQSQTCGAVAALLKGTVNAYADVFTCPLSIPAWVNMQAAVQQFERGSMVWVEDSTGLYGNRIIVTFFDNKRNTLVWQQFQDTWQEGDPVSGGEQAPQGLYEPIRGFGKVWREYPQIRNTLGWATAPEQADTATLQYFADGSALLHRNGTDRVFLLYNDRRADDIARIK
jgi:hypothetical protein